MATVIINHRVNDYTTWKQKFEEDAPRRDAAGARLLAMGQKHDDPGAAYVVFDVTDVDLVGKMMADPELQKRMQDAGVMGAPEVVILN